MRLDEPRQPLDLFLGSNHDRYPPSCASLRVQTVAALADVGTNANGPGRVVKPTEAVPNGTGLGIECASTVPVAPAGRRTPQTPNTPAIRARLRRSLGALPMPVDPLRDVHGFVAPRCLESQNSGRSDSSARLAIGVPGICLWKVRRSPVEATLPPPPGPLHRRVQLAAHTTCGDSGSPLLVSPGKTSVLVAGLAELAPPLAEHLDDVGCDVDDAPLVVLGSRQPLLSVKRAPDVQDARSVSVEVPPGRVGAARPAGNRS